MGVIWHKVWYDLWHNKLRTLLVIVSIAVGVFAIGITFGMVEQMLPTMDAAHQASKPSHVTMYLDQPVDQDTLISVAKLQGVEEVDGYNTVEIRWKLKPGDEWRKGEILQRDYEHQTYDLLQLKEGNWPEIKELGIERMHSPYYHIAPGGRVILEVGDQEHTYPVTSIIRHPFVPPPSMYDLAFFFGSQEIVEQYGIPIGDYAQIKFRVAHYSPENARIIASQVKEHLAKQGISVRSTMYQDPEKHWGRAFLDGMSLVLEVLAILSMLLSIVLVMNTLTAIITQQTNQIGILKAIGGNSFTITKVYLMNVLVYGLLALGIAWPLGAYTSFKISQWFLALYNIDYTGYTLSKPLLILEIFAAIAVPLLAALIPVLGGAAVTVRQAISSYGIGGDFGSSWIDRVIERIGRRFLASYQAISLANTFRRKGRLALTQIVLVTAGVMFIMVMTLSSSLNATLVDDFGRRTHDIVVTLDGLQRVDRITTLVESVPGVQKADLWLAAPATILREGQKALDAGLGSQLQGVPIDDPMYWPMIVEGRWLKPGDNRVVVMNKDTAVHEHIRVGDNITLDLGEWGKQNWQVVGLYQVFLSFGGGYSIDAIYGPRPAVFEATKKNGKGNILLVRTSSHTESDVNQTASLLEDTFEENHIDVNQTETLIQTRKTSDASFQYVIVMLLVLAVIVALVGGIGLMGSLWISVIERTKEIGIMRAIGADSWRIIGMFMLEGVIQGVISWAIATPISLIVAPKMAYALGQTMFQSKIGYQFNLQAVFVWLAIILIISIVASIVPARNASQINVRQSLSYE